MRHLLTHQVALQYRFTNNSGKLPFGQLKLAQAVRGNFYNTSLILITEFEA